MSNLLENLELGSRDLAIVIKELRATLGKMELALGSIDEAIVWTGEDGVIQWCNTTFDRLVNRSHLSVLGCPLCTLVPLTKGGTVLLETEHPVYQVLSQNYSTGEYEFQQESHLLILEIAGSFVELKNGDRTAVLTIRDVTQRKAMEEALISANREMSIYLQEVDKVIQAAIAVENNRFQPDSLHEVANRQDELGRLANIFTQMVLQLKAREQELAEAKEQLEAVLNAVPGAISWIDSGGVFVGVNRHLAENFNLSQEAFVGQEVGFLKENAKLAIFLSEFISSPETSASAIIDYQIHEEKRHYLIAAQKYQQGTATVSVGIDVTDRQRAEAERERFTRELFQLNQAYERFVPNQFLQFLDKSSIVEVELGDQVQLEMSVLFSDIREFTTLSEMMAPSDNFKFINAYLSRMEPAITEHSGFIDKYIGDAIMALFSGEADNAVQAGISMLHRLDEYNQERSKSGFLPIKNGIGINTGLLMLGTVGGQNRMDSTVISNAVNVASRVEGLTKNYGVALLITEATYSRLKQRDSYAIRRIDRVQVKGKSEAVTVYEVFDADSPEMRDRKLATLTQFTEALSLYDRQKFRESARLFGECLDQNPGDRVAQIYCDRAQANI